MKYFVILLILTGIVSAIIPQASACSCAAGWNIEDGFDENDIVIFSGKVTNIKQQQRTFLVTFEIDQSWKGIPDDIANINTMTSQSSSACGYDFAEQESYLVVAYGKWDQTPNVSTCDSTTILDFAHEEISYLNKQVVPITHITQVNPLAEQLPETSPHDPYTDDESLCGLGTIYQDGVCIVINPELDPILTPIRDYDYGLIYMTILLIVGIIGGIVGGVVFVIRRKRK